MIDPNALLLTFLDDDTANAALNALVGDRIYVGRLPNDVTLPAIRIIPVTGESLVHSPVLERGFKFQCYADKGEEVSAMAVARGIHDALHGVSNSTFSIQMGWQDGGESILHDPDTEWPFADVDYTVMFFNS